MHSAIKDLGKDETELLERYSLRAPYFLSAACVYLCSTMLPQDGPLLPFLCHQRLSTWSTIAQGVSMRLKMLKACFIRCI
jgi:hypothetical protein